MACFVDMYQWIGRTPKSSSRLVFLRSPTLGLVFTLLAWAPNSYIVAVPCLALGSPNTKTLLGRGKRGPFECVQKGSLFRRKTKSSLNCRNPHTCTPAAKEMGRPNRKSSWLTETKGSILKAEKKLFPDKVTLYFLTFLLRSWELKRGRLWK